MIGAWHPSQATFGIRWWRQSGQRRTYLDGGGKTRRIVKGRVGCPVTATTRGGVATEHSYNQL